MKRNKMWYDAVRAVAAFMAACAVVWCVAPAPALADTAQAAGQAIEVASEPTAEATPIFEVEDDAIASGTCGTS